MNVFRYWYGELDSLNRDIVRDLCAERRVSLDKLAARYDISRESVRQRRDSVIRTFNRGLEDASLLGIDGTKAEIDLQKPCLIGSLLYRHPWLGETVEDGLTVLDLFLGLRWLDATAESTDQWIYGDDLYECMNATVRTLDLVADEVMSLSAALRMLSLSNVPVPEDSDSVRAWLVHCGFEGDDQQIWLPEPSTEVLAFPSPSHQPDDLRRLVGRLSEVLEVSERPMANITLGEILRDVDALDGALRGVARRLRDAMFVGDGTWIIPDEGVALANAGVIGAGSGENPAVGVKRSGLREADGRDANFEIAESDEFEFSTDSDEGDASQQGASRASAASASEALSANVPMSESPADRIAALLEGRREGMSSSLIKQELGPIVSEEQMVQALFEDDRFAITQQGAWCLQSGYRADASPAVPNQPSLSLFEVASLGEQGTGSTQAVSDEARLQREADRLDKIETVLRAADAPLTIDELKGRSGIQLGHHYLKRQIEADARFSRSQKTKWALAEWGLPVYKPIKELISDMVDAHGGAIASDEVVRVLCRDFEIKESSLRQCMSTPPFTSRGGIVRRFDEEVEALDEVENPAVRAPEPDRGESEGPPDVDDLMDRMGLI